ncbi:MAG: hypothetical protein ACK4NF_04205 [Planctomycetota bacterium]
MNILYTPYNLVLIIYEEPTSRFNSVILKLKMGNENHFNIVKSFFLKGSPTDKILYKLSKKLDWLYVCDFKIECLEKERMLIMTIETPIPRLLPRCRRSFYKVLKVIRNLLLNKFPKQIEELYGLETLLDIYDFLEAQIILRGSFNIAKTFRIFRNYSVYIGFKY